MSWGCCCCCCADSLCERVGVAAVVALTRCVNGSGLLLLLLLRALPVRGTSLLLQERVGGTRAARWHCLAWNSCCALQTVIQPVSTRDQGLHKAAAFKTALSELDYNSNRGGAVFESNLFPASVHGAEFESELDSNAPPPVFVGRGSVFDCDNVQQRQ